MRSGLNMNRSHGHLSVAAMVVGGILIATAGQARADPAINVTTPGKSYSGSEFTLGFEFTSNANQSITALGTFSFNSGGPSGAVTVGI